MTPDGKVEDREEAIERATLYVLQLSSTDIRAFMADRWLRALEQDGYTVVPIRSPEATVAIIENVLQDALDGYGDAHQWAEIIAARLSKEKP